MSKFYEGKDPCPGCGRTGEQMARLSKAGLCYDCAESLRIGKAIVKERGLDRHFYNMNDIKVGYLTWYEIPVAEVDKALRELLQTFSQFDKRNVSGGCNQDVMLAGRADCLTAKDDFVLPTITFEAAKKLCEALKEVCWKVKKDRDNMQKELMDEVAQAKNEIYNEGVQHGRNLLAQLNNGEVTPDDFVKPIKRY